MSEIVSRPRVRSVSSANLAAGAIAAASLFAAALRALSSALRTSNTGESVPRNLPLNAVAARPALAAAPLSAPGVLPAAERIKAEALRELAGSNYFVESAAGWRERVEVLQAATSEPMALAARQTLLDAVAASHRSVFARALTEACVRASAAAGYDRLDPATAGLCLRVVARDGQGRALVSEIRPNAAGEFDLATEVVGVSDGSCHAILDRFELAIQQLGVESGPPERRATGGICQLLPLPAAAAKRDGGPTFRQRLLNAQRQRRMGA